MSLSYFHIELALVELLEGYLIRKEIRLVRKKEIEIVLISFKLDIVSFKLGISFLGIKEQRCIFFRQAMRNQELN